ncbi:YigZ family protein [Thiomicrorhabdus sp. zzn3]|uniref:YigZ family protein n=1 Tax=Thiomicrorhabdus sp. zzn3 TaxID=3039775 RepID=UPI0024363C62|nr:YigZ family protein [Thiomicrorhabdus sp. zzn3]MDG6778732.1 YigZ family protein [Thiomicrorhabdus sp. zzn3]
MSYPIPCEQAAAEIEIKKSRFIAYARHIASREAGMAWLEEIKAQYPDARHHCWAYLIGNPHCASNAGMGDDGEPSGTAGKPILNVLQHKGVGDVMIIVVRYFGGIKLGAGGLTRAYGQAAQAVMEILPLQQRVPMQDVALECDFAQEQQVRHWLQQVEGQLIDVGYQQQVSMRVSVPQSNVAEFCEILSAHRCHYQT